jgi:hypothetical protein
MVRGASNGARVLFAASLVVLTASTSLHAESPIEKTATAALVEEALLKPIRVSFFDVPLVRVVAILSEKSGVPIQIDRASLAEAEIALNSPVYAAINDARLESALSLVAEPLGLQWAVRNDVVMIFNRSCPAPEETRFYPIAKLAHALGVAQGQQLLRRLVYEHVRPSEWEEVGGDSRLHLLPNVLAASMPAQGHAELLLFLCDLEQALGLDPRRSIESQSEQAIQKAMDSNVKLRFDQTALTAAIEEIADQFDVSMVADRRALAEVGLAPEETPIAGRFENVTLRAALNKLLSELDLAWTIRHEAIWITTKAESENSRVRKFYPVDDLISPGKPGAVEVRALLALLTETVAPTSWSKAGGPSVIGAIGAKALVVEQTPGVHQELSLQLARLRQALKLGLAESKADGGPAKRDDESIRQEIYRIDGLSSDDVAKAIQEFIAPESWTDRGGRGMVRAIRASASLPARNDLLVVRQSDAVHQEIAEFLRQLTADGQPARTSQSGGGFF